MENSELSPKNYKRISIINWLLTVPFLILFSWPYLYLAQIAHINSVPAYAGALLFSLPLMITILHGHVTMALGAVHRHHYYSWLTEHPFSYGLMFHTYMMRTRFRMILLSLSFLLFIAGYILNF